MISAHEIAPAVDSRGVLANKTGRAVYTAPGLYLPAGVWDGGPPGAEWTGP